MIQDTKAIRGWIGGGRESGTNLWHRHKHQIVQDTDRFTPAKRSRFNWQQQAGFVSFMLPKYCSRDE